MLDSSEPTREAGPSQALRETIYRYVETEPVGAVVSGLLIAMGVFGGLMSLDLEPATLSFVSLTIIAVLVLIFSARVRRVAFAPAGVAILLILVASEGATSVLHSIVELTKIW